MPHPLLRDLNPAQMEAVLHTGGPLLVLAGAGSGKTKVLTHRFAHLVQVGGYDPHRIFAVTFTNKAAREMGERVGRLFNRPAARFAWLGTFHSLCVRLLRHEIEPLGYSRNFSIYDEDDTRKAIAQAMKALTIDPKAVNPDAVRGMISRAKNQGLNAQILSQQSEGFFDDMVAKIWERYQQILKECDALDFDDLLLVTLTLLNTHPKVARQYQDLFQAILVDEYQDVNDVQYRLLEKLVGSRGEITVVGDDFQAIYGWRGANFANILSFERRFPNARVIKLEQNYRSTQRILAAAQALIEHNRHRTDKKLWTENSEGAPVVLVEAYDEGDEADFVVREIEALKSGAQVPDDVAATPNPSAQYRFFKNLFQDGTLTTASALGKARSQSRFRASPQKERTFALNECAVLYRTNAQSRALEEAFIRAGIPYKIVGALRFWERKEVKDIIAYVNAIVNPQNRIALERIANTPTRGIGAISLATLFAPTPLNEKPQKVQDFLHLMDTLRAVAKRLTPADLIEEILERSGYKAMLSHGTPEEEARLENISELVNVASQYTELTPFLEEVALISDLDRFDPTSDAVTLMTLHTAKGLEFPVVFIVGMEEGIFPHSRCLTDHGQLEEERRLCYVGMTRAKERLYLTWAQSRLQYGTFHRNPPSRFIAEVPDEFIEQLNA